MKYGCLKWCGLLIALLFFTGTTAAYAVMGDIGISAKGSTLGYGGEVTLGLTSAFNARVGVNTFNYNGDFDVENINYSAGLKLKTTPLLLDWHPFGKRSFRLTSGIVFNSNVITGTAKATNDGNISIGDKNYSFGSTNEITSLSGKIDFKKSAPYIGFGWGNVVGKSKSVSFSFDIGAILQGTPNVSLSAKGPISEDPAFKTELEKELANVKETSDKIKYYPVISLGLGVKLW
ncbi:MAG: hypothetical protein WCK32_03285 [Chlorobiaceae bacterium]